MKIKEIECFNLANESLDVIVTLENDASYMVEVVTLQCLATVTGGLKLSQLLQIKVQQLQSLIETNCIISCDTKISKQLCLSTNGKELLNERSQDIHLLFAFKDDTSFVFSTDKDHSKPIQRNTFTKDFNTVLKSWNTNSQSQIGPILTAKSFRTHSVLQLWENSENLTIKQIQQAFSSLQ